MEWWNIGILEEWNNGRKEKWNDGIMGRRGSYEFGEEEIWHGVDSGLSGLSGLYRRYARSKEYFKA
jgi:hypothetical protein